MNMKTEKGTFVSKEHVYPVKDEGKGESEGGNNEKEQWSLCSETRWRPYDISASQHSPSAKRQQQHLVGVRGALPYS